MSGVRVVVSFALSAMIWIRGNCPAIDYGVFDGVRPPIRCEIEKQKVWKHRHVGLLSNNIPVGVASIHAKSACHLGKPNNHEFLKTKSCT